MYAKLFAQVVNSSLTHTEPIEVRGVFFMMLAMADIDGNIPGVDRSIARIINVPLDVFQRAVERLMAPDPESQSEEHEGRRLLPLEVGKGYRIVNYRKYQGIVTDAERRQYFRLKQQESRHNRRQKTLERAEAGATTPEPSKSLGDPAAPPDGPSLTRRKSAPTLEEVLAKASMEGLPETEAEKFFNHYQSTAEEGPNGERTWVINGSPVTNWGALLGKWRANWQERLQKQRGNRGPDLSTLPPVVGRNLQ